MVPEQAEESKTQYFVNKCLDSVLLSLFFLIPHSFLTMKGERAKSLNKDKTVGE